MPMRYLAILLLISTSVGSCAPQPTARSAAAAGPQTARSCFYASEVNSFTGTKDRNVDVRVGANRYYRLELGAGCPNVDWSTRIALRTRAGSSFICEGFDAELIAPDPAFRQQCPVTAIRAITKEQWLADTRS